MVLGVCVGETSSADAGSGGVVGVSVDRFLQDIPDISKLSIIVAMRVLLIIFSIILTTSHHRERLYSN